MLDDIRDVSHEMYSINNDTIVKRTHTNNTAHNGWPTQNAVMKSAVM